MSKTFTDANTGDTFTLPNNSIQEAFKGEEICRLILTNGTEYDVSDTWEYVIGEILGGNA
jgi:hypothetical protein